MRATATFCLTCLLALPAVSFAQAEERPTRRLESVTWDSVKHQLTWIVSKGERVGPEYKPLAQQDYLINMDKATMTVRGETRGFSREEALNVRVLMDLIAKYAVDSTVWWDDGQGDKLDENGNPKPGQRPKRNQPPSKDEGVAVMRVSSPGQPLSQAQVQAEIRELEARLAALHRIDRDRTAEALRVKTY